MVDKKLNKLSRAELLELLLEQTLEVERLRKELETAQRQLEERRLKVKNAGSLANAVLEVNGVVDATQAAAQQYLDNIIEMEKATRRNCIAMLHEAKEEARKIVEKAKSDTDNK